MQCYKCATPIPDGSRFCSACGADVSGDTQGPTLIAPPEPDLQQKLQAELGTEYILEKELGRGGMAIVYGGHDAHLGRRIAVKVLPPELMYGGGSMVERFKREAQTAAKLDHPNIIPVYRVSPGGKLCWYVMKFLDGDSLDHILEREGQMAVDRACDILTQVASALDYAHQNQVVHRDVKPANIVVDAHGRVTVTDFGIAKALDANTLTASGSIIGTPYYMSPEQCKGKRVGPAADQYSLAVMAYQMLGGHVPFTGDSAVEIVHKHVADPVPPLGVLRPQLPPKMVEVIERALAKTAEERFATVAEFARALKAAAEGVTITVAPPKKAPGPRMSKTALVSPVPGALRTARGKAKRSKGLVLALAAVVVLGGGGAAAYFLTRGGGTGAGGGAPTSEIPSGTNLAAGQPSGAPGAPLAVQPGPDTTPPATQPAAAPSKREPSAPTRGARQQNQRTPSQPTQRQLAPQPPAQAAPPPMAQPQAAQPAAQPAPQPSAAASARARLIAGSSPAGATLYIGGREQPRNPMTIDTFPVGPTTVRAVWIDSTGAQVEHSIPCDVKAGVVNRCLVRRPQ